MSLFNRKQKKEFQNKQVVKIISGLSNFQVANIIRKVKAAEIGGATYIDIAANVNIVNIVKSITSLPICVSSIEPLELYKCYLAGADIIEIGNFDIFYNKGIVFPPNTIQFIAQETISLIKNTPICITIPHNLLLHEQIELAISLQELGINLIQTEGFNTSKNKKYSSDLGKVCKSISKGSSALSSSYALSKYINIPIIASSGLELLSASIASYYGASAVGIGSSIKKDWSIYKQSRYICEIVHTLSSQKKYIFLKSINLKMYKVNISMIKSIIFSK